ncbi:MAG: hypothetical protein KF716_14680 [Anaerolineae bacterium]|nr:hypothetical protein [Anaerolineae bacterium]
MLSSKARLKLTIFLIALPVTFFGGLLGFRLLLAFITSFQQGADPASIFHGALLIVPSPDQVTWKSIEVSAPAKQPDRGQQEQISAAYWGAWRSLERALMTGNTSDLATYWAGAAYQQVNALVQTNAGLPRTQRRTQTDLGHQLYLKFYAEDDSVIQFEDRNFSITYTTAGKSRTVHASASIVMTLDNGYWRIRLISLHYDQ